MKPTTVLYIIIKCDYFTHFTEILLRWYPKILTTDFCSVVTDAREWLHYKQRNNIQSPIEEGMFSKQGSSQYSELFLRPKETVNIPFKFQTFQADHSVNPQVRWKSLLTRDWSLAMHITLECTFFRMSVGVRQDPPLGHLCTKYRETAYRISWLPWMS